MSRIDDLLERQGRELDRLTDARAAALLSAYEDARRALLEQLRDTPLGSRETAHRMRVRLAQVEVGVAALRARMGQEMSRAEVAAQQLALKHLLSLIRAQEPHFRDSGAGIEVAVAGRLAEQRALALHRYSVDRYGAQVVENIQRAIVSGVVRGLTDHELAKHIAGASGSVLASMRPRAELIARMELSRAYNDAHLESIRSFAELAEDDGTDPVLKKIDEYFDARNHPFSRAAHGTTALPGEPFRVPVAAVAEAARALGKSSKGVLWSQEGASYVGDNLPCHFGERGRVIAWRASWDEDAAKPTPTPTPTPKPAPAPSPPSPKKAPAATSPGQGAPPRTPAAPEPQPPPPSPAPSPAPAFPAPPVYDLSKVRYPAIFEGTDPDDLRRAMIRIFGRLVTTDEIFSWTGLSPADLVDAIQIDLRLVGPTVELSVNSPRFTMTREYKRSVKGKLYAKHEYFAMKGDHGEQGQGARIFGNAVDALRASGFDSIETHAAGPGGGFNGYYTWPRFGYDGEIPQRFRAKLPPELSSATRLSDLMQTPAGRAWWKANGGDVDVSFDLAPGSLSSRALRGYLAEKRRR